MSASVGGSRPRRRRSPPPVAPSGAATSLTRPSSRAAPEPGPGRRPGRGPVRPTPVVPPSTAASSPSTGRGDSASGPDRDGACPSPRCRPYLVCPEPRPPVPPPPTDTLPSRDCHSSQSRPLSTLQCLPGTFRNGSVQGGRKRWTSLLLRGSRCPWGARSPGVGTGSTSLSSSSLGSSLKGCR